MKRINKTTGGRLFLSALVMLCVLVVGLFGAGEFLIVTSCYAKDLYKSDPDTVFQNIARDQLRSEGHHLLSNIMHYDTDEPIVTEDPESNLIYEIRDSRGKLISHSGPEMNKKQPAYCQSTFTYTVEVVDGQVRTIENYNYGEAYSPMEEEKTEKTEEKDLSESEADAGLLEVAETKKGTKTSGVEKQPRKDMVSYRDTCTVTIGLQEGLPANDWFREMQEKLSWAYKLRYVFPVAGIAAFLLGMFAYILLLLGAGRLPDSDEPAPLVMEQMPWDVMFFIWFICICTGLAMIGEGLYSDMLVLVAGILVVVFLAVPSFIGISLSFVARMRQKKLWKSCLVCRICSLILRILKAVLKQVKQILGILGEGFKNISLIWRTVSVVFGLSLVEFFAIMLNLHDGDIILVFWCFEKMLLIPLVILIVLNLRRLEAGARALAEGNLSHHTDCDNLLPGIRQSADYLNKIGVGMSRALEERLKSERMKTELITNVSHDIKTPLTSVMNYAELIDREVSDPNQEMDADRVKEYSQVLVRQSERLKRLLEDLVEASKAATGNLEVDLMVCNASIFLSQIAGEYEEKLENAGLHLVQKLPEKDLMINADGRRMWRLFSNLMNNICKYSLAGSRVYLTLEEKGEYAVFCFKNTSRNELNLSEEELVERFTRGDSSRHTEGSGLGLAIAKSMADLQGGSLRIITDGDLFKVETSFPIVHRS